MEVVRLEGVGDIRIRRGVHIKYLRIRMAPGRGVWVSVPYGVSGKQVLNFLEENRQWILDHRKSMEVYEQDTGVGLKVGAEIRTHDHLLKIVASEQAKPSYKIENQTVTVFIPERIDFGKVEGIVQQFLIEIYTLEARRYLPQQLKKYAEQFGFRYGRLTFRNNISNWGSCSAEDNISLNIKLMKLPDELIDYVVLHELCHTVEKNHGPAFWKLMGKVCPDYARRRARLRKYNTRI